MLRILRGILSVLLYALNTIFFAITIIFIGLMVILIPIQSFQDFVQCHFLQRTPLWHAKMNQLISLISTKNKWDVLGTGELKKLGWYVMISNHRTWLDILVLGNIFHDKIPPLKFFMKKELLWQLPFAGVACYVLGYPFMSRHTHAEIRKNPSLKGKDIETTQKACKRLRQFPTTLINFVEGTRFTEKKKARQQSPFQHLLKPHAGGVTVAINELHDMLSGIVSVTICYPKKVPTMWEFSCGHFEKIIVRYELLPVSPDILGDYYNDRLFRTQMQQWFNTIWQKNDAFLERSGSESGSAKTKL